MSPLAQPRMLLVGDQQITIERADGHLAPLVDFLLPGSPAAPGHGHSIALPVLALCRAWEFHPPTTRPLNPIPTARSLGRAAAATQAGNDKVHVLTLSDGKWSIYLDRFDAEEALLDAKERSEARRRAASREPALTGAISMTTLIGAARDVADDEGQLRLGGRPPQAAWCASTSASFAVTSDLDDAVRWLGVAGAWCGRLVRFDRLHLWTAVQDDLVRR